jgi:hypothetical protein
MIHALRTPEEQEQFLEHARFGKDQHDLIRGAVPRGKLLRCGLAFISAAVIPFLAVVALGGGLEDAIPLFTIFFALGSALVGIVCCIAALITRVMQK